MAVLDHVSTLGKVTMSRESHADWQASSKETIDASRGGHAPEDDYLNSSYLPRK